MPLTKGERNVIAWLAYRHAASVSDVVQLLVLPDAQAADIYARAKDLASTLRAIWEETIHDTKGEV